MTKNKVTTVTSGERAFFFALAWLFFTLATWIEQSFQFQIQSSLESSELISFAGLLTLTFFLAFTLSKPLICFLWILKLLKPQAEIWSLEKLSCLIREQLRSLGWVFLGLLFFVLPGLIWLIRYSLVPLVVLFDYRYAKGEVDALKASWQWTKGQTLKISSLIALWLFALPALILAFEPYNLFRQHPFHAVLLTSFDFLIFSVVCWCLLKIAEKNFETPFSLEKKDEGIHHADV